MKWKKAIKANGFELSTYSKAIQSSAAQMEALEKERKELMDELKNASKEEISEIQEDINDVEKEIDDLDADLLARINKYDKNREHYAKLTNKLKESREAKKQAKADPVPTPDPAPADPAPVDPAPTDPVPTPDPAAPADPAPKDDNEPKKKGGGGTLLAIGLLVVGSIIGVNLLKKK